MSLEKDRKFNADKAVFIGILVASIVIAAAAASRSGRIALAEVPPIPGSGLRLSMPQGNDWICSSKDRWLKHSGSLIQRCVSRAPGECTVDVWYRLGPISMDAEDYIEAVAGGLRLAAGQSGRIDAHDAQITWAPLLAPDGAESGRYFGVAELGEHRALTISVFCRQNPAYARNVFLAVAQSVQYSHNPLLDDGARTVAQVEQEGLVRLGWNDPGEDFFILIDADARPVGFTADIRRIFPDTGRATAVTVTVDAPSRTPRFTSFVSDIALERQLLWQTHPANLANSAMVRLEGGRARIVAPDELIVQTYRLSPAACTEEILRAAIRQMPAAGANSAIFDLVTARGSVVPALIETVGEPGDDNPAIRISYALEEQVVWDVWLDENGVVVRQVRQSDGLALERADIETVAELFPAFANAVLDLMRDGPHRRLLEHFGTINQRESEDIHDRSPI